MELMKTNKRFFFGGKKGEEANKADKKEPAAEEQATDKV